MLPRCNSDGLVPSRFMKKNFSMEQPTLTMGGVFYPRGWVVLMFSTAEMALRVQADLKTGGYADDEVLFIGSDEILTAVAATMGPHSSRLPSGGSEGRPVRNHETLAQQGHVGLMVYAPYAEETQRVMKVALRGNPSFAQKYHRPAIEDLI